MTSATPIASRFTPQRLAQRLPAAGAWRPFPPIQDRTAWQQVDPQARAHVLADSAAVLSRPWPLLTATGYLRYSVDGDRAGYEDPYFARRTRLAAAVLDAALRGPSPERTGDITDGVWLLCEETSWCVPAHSPEPLPGPARPHIDLFAADTAALLAWTDLLAGDLIGDLSTAARHRLRDEVRRRVLEPYRARDDWWWFGLTRTDLNNWTTWIHSNLLAASLLLDTGREEIITTASRVVAALDRYLAAVPDDGGCDEGIHYWWKAGGCLYDCLETLESACGDDFGTFGIPQVQAIAAYPMLAHIAGQWHVNFADGPARFAGGSPRLLYRFGRRAGHPDLVQHARALRGSDGPAHLVRNSGGIAGLTPWPDGSLGRLLATLFDPEWAAEPGQEFPLVAHAWLPGTGVLIARQQPGRPHGLFLAAKAGHNAEQHNHNDAGSFIVALDGQPLLIDVGVGIYTKHTFGPDRYQIWTMQSSWHNVPEVNGVPQQPGREHSARDVCANVGDNGAELTMELAGAYPPEAGLRSWRRTVRLDRAAELVTLDDAWELGRDAGPVTLHLITAAEPRATADGQLLVPGHDRDLLVRYPPGIFDVRVEERLVSDPRLEATWGPLVWRVALTANRPGRQGAAHLDMTAA